MALTAASARIYEFATNPTVNHDVGSNYERGNFWINTSTNALFQCLDATEGAAIWNRKPTETVSSLTPVLEFGGATTGITYSIQQGTQIQIGDSVWLSAYLALSSKGSATGEARITGLTTANGNTTYAWPLCGHNMILDTGFGVFGARIVDSENEIRLFQQGSDVPINPLDDTNFNNNSQLVVSGFYCV